MAWGFFLKNVEINHIMWGPLYNYIIFNKTSLDLLYLTSLYILVSKHQCYLPSLGPVHIRQSPELVFNNLAAYLTTSYIPPVLLPSLSGGRTGEMRATGFSIKINISQAVRSRTATQAVFVLWQWQWLVQMFISLWVSYHELLISISYLLSSRLESNFLPVCYSCADW